MHRETKKEVARRLKSVEGHVRGVAKMLDQKDVGYRDVVQQTTAIFSAIRSINMVLLRDFMEERAGREGVSEETVDEMIKAVERVTK
ncbi:MAG: metal-sensitive transcriptional regulator [Rubrobacteraceae bacterium]